VKASSSARVAVCIPTFNRSAYLRQAIESVLGQTSSDYLILVSDNASTDDTADVVAAFGDARLSYVRLEQNVGWLGNFNACLGRVDAEFALVLGDDDQLLPTFLEETVAVLDAQPRVGLVHTAFDLVDAEGARLLGGVNWTDGLVEDTVETGDEFIRESMRWSCRVCASTVLLRTAALPQLRFDPIDLPAADFGLWLRIALNWDVAFLAKPLVRYRIHEASDSASWGAAERAGYLRGFEILERTRDVKLRLLAAHGDRWPDRRDLRAQTEWALHREIVNSIRSATLPERRLAPTVSLVSRSLRRHPRLALRPEPWRLVAASLLGRRAVARLRNRRDS
jgi:glycosyltransferase involved in cell wall biosynthesis